MRSSLALLSALMFAGSAFAQAPQLPAPDAVSLDRLGTMSGFPPQPEQLVDQSNRSKYPQMRWVLQHTRELLPTRNIRRGSGAVSMLRMAPRELGSVVFQGDKGQDMTGAVRYREVYTDPTTEVFPYLYASTLLPPQPGYTGTRNIYDFLKTLKKEGEHGAGFVYRTVHSEVLGWVVSRVTGKHFADVMSERIWSRLGMEEDAYVMVDPVGTPLQGAGLIAPGGLVPASRTRVRQGLGGLDERGALNWFRAWCVACRCLSPCWPPVPPVPAAGAAAGWC